MKNKLIDTSGCVNTFCLQRKKCLRYAGIPNPYWQSYNNFAEECFYPDYERFIEMEEEN
jgi:hypothetical protein